MDDEAALGKLLLAIVSSARAAGLEPERALREATRELQVEIRSFELDSDNDAGGSILIYFGEKPQANQSEILQSTRPTLNPRAIGSIQIFNDWAISFGSNLNCRSLAVSAPPSPPFRWAVILPILKLPLGVNATGP